MTGANNEKSANYYVGNNRKTDTEKIYNYLKGLKENGKIKHSGMQTLYKQSSNMELGHGSPSLSPKPLGFKKLYFIF